jgi:hypothetical protein
MKCRYMEKQNLGKQLNFDDLLLQIEIEEERKREASEPYRNAIGELLPWEIPETAT